MEMQFFLLSSFEKGSDNIMSVTFFCYTYMVGLLGFFVLCLRGFGGQNPCSRASTAWAGPLPTASFFCQDTAEAALTAVGTETASVFFDERV